MKTDEEIEREISERMHRQYTPEPETRPAGSFVPGTELLPVHVPATLKHTRRLSDDRLLLAGVGPEEEVEIMLLATTVHPEQAMQFIEGKYQKMKDPARYSKGPAWGILKDVMQGVDLDINKCYFTSLVKWLLPQGNRFKPTREQVSEMLPILKDEIKRKKPKIIVTFGKPAFEAVVSKRLKFLDIQAAWFWSDEFECHVFVMPEFHHPVLRPEYVEVFAINFAHLSQFVRESRGEKTEALPVRYSVINTADELRAWVAERMKENIKVWSPDTEFGGLNFVDGKLRSLQLAWTVSDAIYIRFMDENMNYVFDVSYRDAGKILAPLLNPPDVLYVGHHISADLPWMWDKLGLAWYDKVLMDTEFSEQTLDENAELGAERIALRYTTLGRYDIDLINWKAENHDKHSNELGYLLVPDEILIPYACKDVLVVMRAAPQIARRLMYDGTYDYYNDYRNALVGNLFTQFALLGLPVRQERMDSLRKLYSYCKELLEKQFIEHVVEQSYEKLFEFALDHVPDPAAMTEFYNFARYAIGEGLSENVLVRPEVQHLDTFKQQQLRTLVEHAVSAPTFNIRSGPAKIRWLFHVCGFTPIKSTKNLDKGMPSLAWEKVMSLPEARRKLFTPAADKQSISMLADQTGDPLLKELLDLLAVGNVSKAFLKEATMDDDTGEVTKENGLHYWVASDGKIHANYSCTETGRPRGWKPNPLNWPSYVHVGVKRGMALVLQREKAAGKLPEEFEQYLDAKKIPSIRSVIDVEKLPPLAGSKGWCLVESDYNSAELRGLAFMSGDEAMIRYMTEPDPQFGIPIGGDPEEDRVRLCYADDCGIPEHGRNQDYIMAQVVEGKLIKRYAVDELMKNEDGSISHPSHDLHWSLVEWVTGGPRENYSKKVFRTGVGKVGNFSSIYGATAKTLERKIEADTNKKPEPGTGERILFALEKQRPQADQFLKILQDTPRTIGYWQAQSGAKRRFAVHGSNVNGLSERVHASILSALGREARNFPMQGGVADTAARAGKWLMTLFRERRLNALPMVILYDSIVTLCPIEERHIVADLHEQCMAVKNTWHHHGRTWYYTITTEFNFAWSWRPSKEWQAKLNDKNWNSDPLGINQTVNA